MIPPLPKRIAIGAGLVALASFGVVDTLGPGALSDWLTTFSATLVSAALAVAGGIWLFHYQTSINDDKEHTRLQTMLALETRLNLDTLEERPAVVLYARTGEDLGHPVMLVQLPMTALEGLIHSGFDDPGVSYGLMRLAALMRVHNIEIASLLGSREGTITRAAISYMTTELAQRQQVLKDSLEDLLRGLREAGIEPPSQQRNGRRQIAVGTRPYSPNVRQNEFSELRMYRILGSSSSSWRCGRNRSATASPTAAIHGQWNGECPVAILLEPAALAIPNDTMYNAAMYTRIRVR